MNALPVLLLVLPLFILYQVSLFAGNFHPGVGEESFIQLVVETMVVVSLLLHMLVMVMSTTI